MGFSFIVLTTFYPAAQRAVHYADNLASTLGGRLVLLHINRSSVNGLYAFAGEAWKEQEQQLAAQTSNQLHQMAKQLHTPATVELATDLLPTVAQGLGQRYPAALFVVGLSDADTPSIERLCATALELLRAAQQPVLVVPRGTRAASPPRRVLFAADQEAFTLPTAAAVNELLRGLGAELTVAHVSTVEDDAGCAQALRAVEASGLATGLPTVQLRGYLHQSPAAGLLEALVDTQADLLLVVARSRTYLGELFHRSVTAQVLGRCPVPVLVLPAAEH
ncbi:universal stress protein [Hymenobacter sp. HD11105]